MLEIITVITLIWNPRPRVIHGPTINIKNITHYAYSKMVLAKLLCLFIVGVGLANPMFVPCTPGQPMWPGGPLCGMPMSPAVGVPVPSGPAIPVPVPSGHPIPVPVPSGIPVPVPVPSHPVPVPVSGWPMSPITGPNYPTWNPTWNPAWNPSWNPTWTPAWNVSIPGKVFLFF